MISYQIIFATLGFFFLARLNTKMSDRCDRNKVIRVNHVHMQLKLKYTSVSASFSKILNFAPSNFIYKAVFIPLKCNSDCFTTVIRRE